MINHVFRESLSNSVSISKGQRRGGGGRFGGFQLCHNEIYLPPIGLCNIHVATIIGS